MSQGELFIQLIKKMFGMQTLTKEQRFFLHEIFEEICGFLENPVYGPTYSDVLFSEVETNQVFRMGGEDYCKISDTQYVHMVSRQTSTMSGNPVVVIWIMDQ